MFLKKFSTVVVTSLLVVTLAACSSPKPETDSSFIPPDPKTNTDLPPVSEQDKFLVTPEKLAEDGSFTLKVGETLKVNVPENDFSSVTATSSNEAVATYIQGNIISEGNPKPTTPPSFKANNIGESEISFTDSKGKKYDFTIKVTE